MIDVAGTNIEFEGTVIGTIPGAVLLTNSESYDTNLLPKDKAGEVLAKLDPTPYETSAGRC